MTPEFKAWPKIPRLNRNITITEKIDGTNAAVIVTEEGEVFAQSRKRILTEGKGTDNFGFATWCAINAQQLVDLGVGYHYGEWWGKGIQRGYGLDERRFSLFNPDTANVPDCCDVVPVLDRGTASCLNDRVALALIDLRTNGSAAADFPTPEGIVVYHHAANQCFKVLLEGDEIPKGVAA